MIDLGELVLLPGLINAHCHLDYTMMRHAISPPKSFTAWVQRINALKRSLDNDDYLARDPARFCASCGSGARRASATSRPFRS